MVKAKPAPDKSGQVTETESDAEHEPRNHREARTAQHVALELLLHGVEAVGHPLLATEGTQDRVVLDALLHMHLDAAFLFADIESHAAETPSDKLPEDNGKRRKNHERPGKPRVKESHEQEGAQQLDRRHHHLRQRIGNHTRNRIDVFREARSHVAGVEFLLVEKAPGKKLRE